MRCFVYSLSSPSSSRGDAFCHIPVVLLEGKIPELGCLWSLSSFLSRQRVFTRLCLLKTEVLLVETIKAKGP